MDASALTAQLDTLSALKARMGALYREAALSPLSHFAASQQLAIKPLDADRLGMPLADNMVLMSLSGPDLQLLFKLHFTHAQAHSRLSPPQAVEASLLCQPLPQKSIDYMKEIANQICGLLCRQFVNQGVFVGLSVPLYVRGYYDIYADYTDKNTPLLKFGDGWTLEGPFGELACSTYTEITGDAGAASLLNITFNDENDDIEFL